MEMRKVRARKELGRRMEEGRRELGIRKRYAAKNTKKNKTSGKEKYEQDVPNNEVFKRAEWIKQVSARAT
jgi:hypothetical protein